jgi:predicted site-specific integrase-resolvase
MDVDGSLPVWHRSRTARAVLGVSGRILGRWATDGRIRSLILPGPGKRCHRLYDLASVGTARPPTVEPADNRGGDDPDAGDVIYARVSTRKQQGDLDRRAGCITGWDGPCRQVAALRAAHPTATRILTDVASGINFRRRGLAQLLELAFARRVRTVPGPATRRCEGPRPSPYVAHRDRLCRFAFELIADVLRRCGASVHVDSHDPTTSTPDGELADDILSIVTVFGARLYGARSGRNRGVRAATTAPKATPRRPPLRECTQPRLRCRHRNGTPPRTGGDAELSHPDASGRARAIRAHPVRTAPQRAELRRWFDCGRWAYNAMVQALDAGEVASATRRHAVQVVAARHREHLQREYGSVHSTIARESMYLAVGAQNSNLAKQAAARARGQPVRPFRLRQRSLRRSRSEVLPLEAARPVAAAAGGGRRIQPKSDTKRHADRTGAHHRLRRGTVPI